MAGFIDDMLIEEVRDRVDIVDLISSYLPLKKAGSNYKGLCPFHSEKTPSFTVSEREQFYHCFGCGAGGDAIEFIIQRENLNFVEAIEFLANKYGIEIRQETREEKAARSKKELAYEINREAAKFFLYNLSKNQEAINYLKARGIDNKLSRKFGLGYALDDWESLYKYLREKGYDQVLLEELGLVAARKNANGYYDRFRNRIIFPIIDTRSRVIGFGGRVMDDSMPKYLNSKETITFNKSHSLYGINMVDKLSDRKSIVLVEGYMDVISMYANDINCAVASLGTAFTGRQAEMLKRYGENIYICYDSDQAGINATNKAILTLLEEDIIPKVINLGKYKDPDDYFKENSSQDFKLLMKQALSFIDYKIFINKLKYDLDTIDGKINFTKEISKELSLLKNPIEREVYIDELAKSLNIDKEAIKIEVKRNYRSNSYRQASPLINQEQAEVEPKSKTSGSGLLRSDVMAEIGILKLLILDKKYLYDLDKRGAFSYFKNESSKEILESIKKIYRQEDFLDKNRLYDIMRGRSNVQADILDRVLDDEITYTSEAIPQMIDDLIKTLNISQLKAKRAEIRDKIEKVDKGLIDIDTQESFKLLKELKELNEKLDSIRY